MGCVCGEESKDTEKRNTETQPQNVAEIAWECPGDSWGIKCHLTA